VGWSDFTILATAVNRQPASIQLAYDLDMASFYDADI